MTWYFCQKTTTPNPACGEWGAYIFGCPVFNEEARRKLENMEEEVPEQYECEKKEYTKFC